MVSILAFCAIFAVCGLMLWGSYKIEPHWVSKDGDRLVCYAQSMTSRGEPIGRWREVRISKFEHGQVEVRTRRGSFAAKDRWSDPNPKISRMTRVMQERNARASLWRVSAASDDPPARKVVYLLDGNTDVGMPDLIALRMPSTSRAIPMLESMVANKSNAVGRPSKDPSASN
ncbi:MAG: hypothetical protein ABIR32_21840 [Ilumatobacteraceae bacterium]